MNIGNQQMELIKEKKWWNKTDDRIKNKIIELVEKNPILEQHFLSLGEKNEQDEIEMISEILVSKENIIVELILISKLTNQKYNQEYVFSYKDSIVGGKCLIILETKNKQKWIILQKITKPWIGKPIFGAMTAFFPDFSRPDLCTFSSKTTKGISELCSNNDWQIKKILDLGLSWPNAEYVANKIPIFVVNIVSGVEEIKNEDGLFLIEKAENIMNLDEKCNDALTSSIILKFISNKDDK